MSSTRQTSYAYRDGTPTRKVGSAALAGALVAVLVWALDAYTGVAMPPEVASGLTVVVTFLVGYLVPDYRVAGTEAHAAFAARVGSQSALRGRRTRESQTPAT